MGGGLQAHGKLIWPCLVAFTREPGVEKPAKHGVCRVEKSNATMRLHKGLPGNPVSPGMGFTPRAAVLDDLIDQIFLLGTDVCYNKRPLHSSWERAA